ncbi:MAG: PEP-CTERM sorting domain-containing protein, partial [Sphingomonadaceae bacterium]
LSAELTASGDAGFGFGYLVGTGSPVAAVPEPSSWLLLLLGTSVILVRCRRARTQPVVSAEELTV